MNYAIALNFLQQSDPILGQLIDEIGDCQLISKSYQTNLLSVLAWSVLSQQISTRAANTIYRRLLKLYSDSPILDADILLKTPDEILRSIGITSPKIRYLKNIAAQILLGLPTLSELETMEDETIIQLLTQIKGVGRWTVQMLLIFRLNRLDILPTDDLGIRQAIKKLYQLETLPNRKTIEFLGEKWKPYRTIASWYLWRSGSESILGIKL